MFKKNWYIYLLVILCVVFIVGLVFMIDIDNTIETPITSETPSSEVVDIVIPEPTPDTTEPDKEIDFNFDTIIIEDREEAGFVDSSEDLENLYVNPTFKIATDFSNGFVATTTEHITCVTNTAGYAEYGGNGTRLYVVEYNPLENTIQSLHQNTLEKYFPTYLYHKPIGFERDDTEVGVGLKSKEEHFEMVPTLDVTFEGTAQILADTSIETALGTGLLLEYYSPSAGQYTAIANIQCDRDRIIQIRVIATSENNLIDYITEVTNEGIYLIK